MQKNPVLTGATGFLMLDCLLANKLLYSSANFIGADAAGADANGLMLTVRHNNLAFLQVGVLEETVMLVGKAYFIGFIAAFFAHFANCCHGEGILYFALQSSSEAIEPSKCFHGNNSRAQSLSGNHFVSKTFRGKVSNAISVQVFRSLLVPLRKTFSESPSFSCWDRDRSDRT